MERQLRELDKRSPDLFLDVVAQSFLLPSPGSSVAFVDLKSLGYTVNRRTTNNRQFQNQSRPSIVTTDIDN